MNIWSPRRHCFLSFPLTVMSQMWTCRGVFATSTSPTRALIRQHDASMIEFAHTAWRKSVTGLHHSTCCTKQFWDTSESYILIVLLCHNPHFTLMLIGIPWKKKIDAWTRTIWSWMMFWTSTTFESPDLAIPRNQSASSGVCSWRIGSGRNTESVEKWNTIEAVKRFNEPSQTAKIQWCTCLG